MAIVIKKPMMVKSWGQPNVQGVVATALTALL
jgi:hypothetical protein